MNDRQLPGAAPPSGTATAAVPLHWTKRTTWILLTVAVLLATLVGIAWNQSEHLPTLEATGFEAARDRWRQSAPANYELEVRVSGKQAATYTVTVRDQTVVNATRNGKPLKQLRTLGTWSVPGMFETIGVDLEHEEDVRAGRDKARPGLTLRARFHPQFGFPERYVRLEHSRMGTNPEVSWEVTRFEPQPAKVPDS